MFAKVMLGGLALGAAACASVRAPIDMRGRTALTGTEPRLLIAGPARLLHVNADRTGLTVYRVPRQEGTEADCRVVKSEQAVDWDRESVLQIGKDETVCVSGRRLTQLSWHARSARTEPVGTQQASLDLDSE
jgi:hypothetical protein